jgi:hypothetical protein
MSAAIPESAKAAAKARQARAELMKRGARGRRGKGRHSRDGINETRGIRLKKGISGDHVLKWSEWWDSNPRPPRPERGALAMLRYTPNKSLIKLRSPAQIATKIPKALIGMRRSTLKRRGFESTTPFPFQNPIGFCLQKNENGYVRGASQ